MPNYQKIQDKVDRGRGKVAAALGTPHDVYRVTTGSGNLIKAGNLVGQAVYVFKKISTAQRLKGAFELEPRLGPIYYEIACDLTSLPVGDVFLNADPNAAGDTKVTFATNDIDGFVNAYHGPLKIAVGVRVNALARIYRNSGVSDGEGSQPLPLLCTDGSWGIGAVVGDPADILPVGYGPQSSGGAGAAFDDVPGVGKRSSYYFYLPPTKGFRVIEGDDIYLHEGSRFRVTNAFYQDTGICGGYLRADKMSSGGAGFDVDGNPVPGASGGCD